MEALTGKQFKNLVKGSGLTMKAIGEEAGVNGSTLSQWGNGKQDIMHDGTYNKLIEAYKKLKEDVA